MLSANCTLHARQKQDQVNQLACAYRAVFEGILSSRPYFGFSTAKIHPLDNSVHLNFIFLKVESREEILK